jgi:sugar lactone lactonase YvrE
MLQTYLSVRGIRKCLSGLAVLSAIALSTTNNATGQIISTIAGIGIQGSTGDNGPATAAALRDPIDVATDDSGNVYFIDPAYRVVRKINASGIVRTIIGNGIFGYSGDNGPATNAGFNNPVSIARDRSGNMYIADYYDHRVRKIATDGIITTIAGTGVSGFSGDGGAATAAQLFRPYGLATDNAGNLYICDSRNFRIRKIDNSGIITTVAGNGYSGYTGDGGPATVARLYEPIDLASDPLGNLYYTDYNRIRKIDTAGIITTFAGNGILGIDGDGGPATAAAITSHGIGIDLIGNIYFSDANNCRIRKVDIGGTLSTIAGSTACNYTGDNIAALSAGLYYPKGVCTDNAGSVYIADQNNNRIRKISFGDVVTYTDVTRKAKPGLRLYPNPGNGTFTFSLITDKDETVTVSVFNTAGSVVQQMQTNTNGQTAIRLDVAAGTYILRAVTPGQSYVTKLQVVK